MAELSRYHFARSGRSLPQSQATQVCRLHAGNAHLVATLARVGRSGRFNPEYYTAENDSFDLPYDQYDPASANPKTQIEIIQPDKTLEELSSLSPIVAAISGRATGDTRFYFPKAMLGKPTDDLFTPIYQEFQHYILNGALILENPMEDDNDD